MALYWVFALCLVSVKTLAINPTDEIVSPLRIAQCRAKCLEKFSPTENSHESCLQGPDCFMCWENCELLQANFQIWGSICETDICYPGCQEACKFHQENPQRKQAEPVIRARGEELLKVSDGVARWPRPGAVPSGQPLVYIVMRRNADTSWTQIVQTVTRTVRLTPADTTTATTTLRVLVVNPHGLVTMYSTMSISANVPKLSESKVSRILAGVVGRRNSDKVNLNTPKSTSWGLKEVSLIHQKILVLAEVSWEPRQEHAEYLVTWEVDGGGLKGNLFTDTTCVTLSLWPDTIYHIQVELVSHADRSPPLTLDTHKALQVSFDLKKTADTTPDFKPTRRIFASRKDVSLEEELDAPKSHLKTPPRISSSVSSVVLKSDSTAAELIDTRQEAELIFGLVAAVFLFLIICALILLRTQRPPIDLHVSGPKLIESDRTQSRPIIVSKIRSNDLQV